MDVPDGPRPTDFGQMSGGIRLPRPTIRLRLTLLFGALFLLLGATLLAVTYLLVSNATGNPVVVTGPNGEMVVRFSGAVSGPTVNVVSGVPPPGSQQWAPGPEQLQALAEQQHAAEQNQLLVWSGIALAIMAVVAVGIGWLAAGRVLSPMRTMTAAAREISATNLHRRLALEGPDDELNELGRTFNDLLSRLERSFEAQRRFVANASHELRTPLARQRTLLQVALSDPGATVDSLQAVAARVLAAGAQQEDLIESLLTLARGERGLERREPVDLNGIVADVVEAGRAAAVGLGLRMDVRLDPATASGAPRLIERLAANLVDNAVRHNEAEGWVEVSTTTRAGSAVLRVANSGPLVPEAELIRLFQPFQRLGEDRTGHGVGWGLGLSIVRAIATAHGAVLDVRARPEGGLAIEVSFPP
jgi:signal transduction histidine kinase